MTTTTEHGGAVPPVHTGGQHDITEERQDGILVDPAYIARTGR